MAKASVMRGVSFNLLRNQSPIFPNQDSQSFSTIPIKSNSRLPQQSHYRNQISIANLLQRYGFPSSLLHSFLSKNNRFLLQMNLKDMEKSLGILFSFKIPQNELVSLVCECPGVLDCHFLNNWEMSFSQLGLSTVSPSMVRSVLEHSRKYHLDPNGFFKTLVVLRGMGFNNATLSRVLEGFPEVTLMNESEIRRRVEFLMAGIPMSAEGVDWILHSFPEVLGFGVEDRLKPLISEFKALGFDNDLISREISRDPRILSMELGELSRCFELLRSLKCRVAILEKIYSEGEFRAGFEVKLRVDYFCKQGLTRREAFEVLWKEPRSIVYKMEEVEKKVDFLVNRMKFNIRCLLDVPEYVGVNFDKQIVPRFNVIEYLRSKDGLGSLIGLRALIKPSRLKFYNLYVKPYPECLKFFGRYSDDVEVKSQQPVGLWKILKPQSKPATKEDVENMKVFMKL
ncbi:transcription termination factor MTERF15, mitochondrial isoform X1 [Cannabis sativa]|uniref:transcription termination factor MTERF15, mitochondrial isoform X1 n=2 Tax=Cannabis sativa TaxID=3483 RepID=UPI0029CA727C|nr:transcription termination factor MTERF15, mitochondrial isoform X1 [Cannabis sativa]XP_060960242.1 transcription termination factor MTERF15, mitochondrial isoform X1 [Cannabis sativa]